jgi:hypothetical protein
MKEIDRISAGTFSAIPDKLLSQTSEDLSFALSFDLISRHYYPSCVTQQEANASEMESRELTTNAVHVAQVAGGDLSPYNKNGVD